jgi:hypothetical protein
MNGHGFVTGHGFTGCGKSPNKGELGNNGLAGAKAQVCFVAFAARLKSCPVTKRC